MVSFAPQGERLVGQRQGAEAFVVSWQDLLARIGARHQQLSR